MAVKKSKGEIKEQVKRLKKAGLVHIDLRKVTDNTLADKKERSNLLRTINRFSNFLKGKEAVVKVSDKQAREALASRGYRVKRNGLVLVSKKPDESVKVSKSGNLTFTREIRDRKTGRVKLEVINEPNINFKNIQSVEEAVNMYAKMYTQGQGDKISFTYYGNISKKTFANVHEAMLEIISYTQNQNDIGTSLNPADVPEIMKAVQMVRYIDKQNYSRARAEILDNKADFNRYFKKLTKKRV